jgi:hypothetical protein
LTLNWQELTERILEQLTNILHPLSGSLDQRRSCHVGVTDPANNDQAQKDRHNAYRRCVITLSHGRALLRDNIRSSLSLAHVAERIGGPGCFIRVQQRTVRV